MAPQSTPGRRRERGDKYLPYNARPKDVGTATGLPMPSPQQLNSDGFEDPDQFFKSPNTTVRDPAMESIVSALRRTPGGASVESLDGGSGRKKQGRGRMSQLGGESDEEIGGGDGERLLLGDEDEGFDDALSTPGQFFRDSRHKSVPIPKRSMLPPASPSISTPYESLPSPSRRQFKRATQNLPPTPSTGKTSRFNHTTRDSPGVGDDEGGSLDMDLETEVDITPRTNKGRKSGMTDVSDIGVGRDGRSSLGRFAGRKSGLSKRVVEDDDNDDDDDGGGVGVGDESADLGGMSIAFDDGGDVPMETSGDVTLEAAENVDEDVGVQGVGDEVQEEDNPDEGVSLEAAAIAEENREESDNEEGAEDDEERRPAGKKKKAQAPVKKAVVKRKPAGAVNGNKGPLPIVKSRKRLSRLPAEEEGDGYHGDFQMRRSNRRHMAPLEFWRNEKVEFVRGKVGPEPVQVVRIPKEEAGPLHAKKRTRGRPYAARSRSKNSDEGDENRAGRGELEGEGIDDETEPLMQVLDYITGMEAMRRIACPRSRFDPAPVSGGQFKYQKMFGDEGYFATGIVVIPVGSEKPAKPSKDNCYMFHVIRGIVQVTLHATEFTMGPGSMFFIPRGNTYQIKNLSENDEAELVFSQARKIKEGEDDTAAGKRMLAELEKKKADRNGRGESLGRLTEVGDGDEEEDEGSVKPDIVKRKR